MYTTFSNYLFGGKLGPRLTKNKSSLAVEKHRGDDNTWKKGQRIFYLRGVGKDGKISIGGGITCII